MEVNTHRELVVTHLLSYFAEKMDGPGVSSSGLDVTHPQITILFGDYHTLEPQGYD